MRPQSRGNKISHSPNHYQTCSHWPLKNAELWIFRRNNKFQNLQYFSGCIHVKETNVNFVLFLGGGGEATRLVSGVASQGRS